MLDGPYPPRVVPATASAGDHDAYSSVQRTGAQWNRVAAAPVTPAGGMYLTAPTPCGIPWNRLYSSGTAPEQPVEERKRSGHLHEKSPVARKSDGQSSSPASYTPSAMAAGSLLYRPSYFTQSYNPPPPPPPPPTGAPATVSAYGSAAGHHYHADETPPASHTSATASPASRLASSSIVASSRYLQLAAEHRYGCAAPRPASSSHVGHPPQAAAAHEHSIRAAFSPERSENVSRHSGFRDRVSAREDQPPPQVSSARGSAQHRWRTPFSRDVENSGNGSKDGVDVQLDGPQRSNLSQKSATIAVPKPERSSSATVVAATATSNAPGVGSAGGSQRSDSASAASSRPQSRTRPNTSAQQQLQRRASPARAVPRRKPSAGPAAGGVGNTNQSSFPRTAQWAVKLIDELVAQVAVQQRSSTTGPAVVSAAKSGFVAGGGGGGSGRAKGPGEASATPPPLTVADLMTSFLSSRYGALQWRPMLQDFAVSLHRYHTFSPACAVFREYFIHVDADTLDDFHLFCRLFAAADIPHCSTVEVRRVVLRRGRGLDRRGPAHTILPRRYVEVREVVDRLQRMLQHVVLTDAAPCVVVGQHMDRAASRGRRNGAGQYRYARGPPARTVAVPRRRHLTAAEIRSVKKVVMAWLEESVEAERDAMDEEDDESVKSDNTSVTSAPPATLRHIAFDRPGRVDAYALLQATLEAVKLICTPSPTHADALAGKEPDDDEEDDAESVAYSETKSERMQREERQARRRDSQSQQRPGSQQQQQPSWQAATPHTHSPLVRHVLASPPNAYAYPVDEGRPSPLSAAASPRRASTSSALLSPQREVRRSDRQFRNVAAYDSDEEEREEVEEWYRDEERSGRRKSLGNSRDSGRHLAHQSPSYRQPRAASVAGGVAVRRSADGRLWSPPRDGLVEHRGDREAGTRESSTPFLHERRRPSREESARRASTARSRDPLPSPSYKRQLHVRRADVQPTRRGHVSVMEDDYSDNYEEVGENSTYAQKHYPSSPQSHRTPHQRPERSPTSSPLRDQGEEPLAPNAYVADLHAEKRWQQVQRQVAAAERRDSLWRQHPRIQARLHREEQQQQQQFLHEGAVGTAPPCNERSMVDATIQDIDSELRRREQSNSRVRTARNDGRPSAPQGPSPSLQNTQAVLYLRDPQEAAVVAGANARLVPPPELPRTSPTSMAAYPARIHSTTPNIHVQHGSEAASPMRTTVPSVAKSQIKIERVSPPPSAEALRESSRDTRNAPPSADRVSLLPSAGLHFATGAALSKDAVLLTEEEQAMLDQLEVALHRLDTQHRRDHSAAAAACGDGDGQGG